MIRNYLSFIHFKVLNLFYIKISRFKRVFKKFNCGLHISLEEKDFDFDFEISEDDLYLEFDNKRLERAIGNLIINSVKYNKKGTKFLVSLKKKRIKLK